MGGLTPPPPWVLPRYTAIAKTVLYIYIYTYTKHFVFALVVFDIGLPGRLLVDIIVPVELFWQMKGVTHPVIKDQKSTAKQLW